MEQHVGIMHDSLERKQMLTCSILETLYSYGRRHLIDRVVLSAGVTFSLEAKIPNDLIADIILECLMGVGPTDSSLNYSSELRVCDNSSVTVLSML